MIKIIRKMEHLRWKDFVEKLAIIFIFVVVIGGAFLYRTYDYQREAFKYPEFTPFTLECALIYSYAWDIAKYGHLEAKDRLMANESKYDINQQMSVGLEYFLGYAFRLKNHFFEPFYIYDVDGRWGVNFEFLERTRIQIRLWISLTAGIIFLLLFTLRCSYFLASLGGLLFVVMPGAIARATGQDLIMENFAIPLLMFILLVYYSYRMEPSSYKLFLLAAAVYLGLSSWDMSQLFFALWLVFEVVRLSLGGIANKKYKAVWIFITIGSVIAGSVNPYLSAHNFLCSPAMSVLLPCLILLMFLKPMSKLKKGIYGIAFLTVLVLLWIFIFRKMGYGENYSHFLSLILAKIKFFNVKPLDPALLDFDSRVLWTPALHSATWQIMGRSFNIILPFFFILLLSGYSIFVISRTLCRFFPRSGLFLFLTLSYFILFVFMVRFEALLAPMLCIAIPIIIQDIGRVLSKRVYVSVLVLFSILLILEAAIFFSMTREYADDNSEQIDLIKELNSSDSLKTKVILADFTLSPMLRAYCGAKIVLTPKFELKNDRDNVKEYLNEIYHGTEGSFLKFCEKHGVNYFIFDKGLAFGGEKTEYLHPWSARYMVDAKVLNEKCPVYLFYFNPLALRHFYKLDIESGKKVQQNRFELYKVITDEDISNADMIYADVLKALKGHQIIKAKAMIKTVLFLDPASERARFLFYQLYGDRWPVITKDGVN